MPIVVKNYKRGEKMDKIFFIGIIIGILSRLIMLHLDQKQYPTEPNILLSQLVLAFVASALGSLLVPALHIHLLLSYL